IATDTEVLSMMDCVAPQHFLALFGTNPEKER
ncbi:MAG: hypothetical protein QOE20_157, partial [Mycobacterium sp.]|nr:hypothetical protein [Mycobacterium sp.]